MPRLGLSQWVFDGDAKRTVDSGHTWHWAGTGLVGQGADSVMFGHRTEHGGPYRYQHLLQGGDLAYVTTSDGRRYTYQMVADVVTSKYSNDILADDAAHRWRDDLDRGVLEAQPSADQSRVPVDLHVPIARLGRPRLTQSTACPSVS